MRVRVSQILPSSPCSLLFTAPLSSPPLRSALHENSAASPLAVQSFCMTIVLPSPRRGTKLPPPGFDVFKTQKPIERGCCTLAFLDLGRVDGSLRPRKKQVHRVRIIIRGSIFFFGSILIDLINSLGINKKYNKIQCL